MEIERDEYRCVVWGRWPHRWRRQTLSAVAYHTRAPPRGRICQDMRWGSSENVRCSIDGAETAKCLWSGPGLAKGPFLVSHAVWGDLFRINPTRNVLRVLFSAMERRRTWGISAAP